MACIWMLREIMPFIAAIGEQFYVPWSSQKGNMRPIQQISSHIHYEQVTATRISKCVYVFCLDILFDLYGLALNGAVSWSTSALYKCSMRHLLWMDIAKHVADFLHALIFLFIQVPLHVLFASLYLTLNSLCDKCSCLTSHSPAVFITNIVN